MRLKKTSEQPATRVHWVAQPGTDNHCAESRPRPRPRPEEDTRNTQKLITRETKQQMTNSQRRGNRGRRKEKRLNPGNAALNQWTRKEQMLQ